MLKTKRCIFSRQMPLPWWLPRKEGSWKLWSCCWRLGGATLAMTCRTTKPLMLSAEAGANVNHAPWRNTILLYFHMIFYMTTICFFFSMEYSRTCNGNMKRIHSCNVRIPRHLKKLITQNRRGPLSLEHCFGNLWPLLSSKAPSIACTCVYIVKQLPTPS